MKRRLPLRSARMLRTIAAGAALGCVSAQVLMLSGVSAAVSVTPSCGAPGSIMGTVIGSRLLGVVAPYILLPCAPR